MTEYFYTVRSNAAPFFSDDWDGHVEASSAMDAVSKIVAEADHPAGLYAAEVWTSADAMKKKEKPLATWRSERALKMLKEQEDARA